MTTFWIICALLLVVALLFVVWPLWRHTVKNNEVIRDAANLDIFRDQSAEMEADLANGLLTEELYEQGKRELQARMLEEVKSPEGSGAGQMRNPLKALAVALLVLVPLSAIGLYMKLGNLNAFLPQDKHATAEGFGAVLSPAALKELQDKLAAKPDDPQGWLLLARSLVEMERYGDAAKAYDKLTQLVPNEAQLWTDYADALAMSNGQSLVGEPTQLLAKALAIDPNNLKALALNGSAGMERGDYPTAIRDWEKLLQLMPNKNSDDAKMVAAGISQARTFLTQIKSGKAPMMAQAPAAPSQSKPAVPGKERITGTVALSAALKGEADPNDTVFILARAAEGPPMPLAVIRKQVRDLPYKFTLDDSMAMAPQMKLSNFDNVLVIARVSKSGNAMPQSGDLQGMSAPLKPGKTGLKISIDQEVK
ncbi:MAG: c-type cytochrome biogenesis protein CcmI [Sideroxydans sp.]|nr:c-type cytochrome biogenesis protein CcmI [Sideroxydans sp.]